MLRCNLLNQRLELLVTVVGIQMSIATDFELFARWSESLGTKVYLKGTESFSDVEGDSRCWFRFSFSFIALGQMSRANSS